MLSYEFKERLRKFLQAEFQAQGDEQMAMLFRFLLLPRLDSADALFAPGTLAWLSIGDAKFAAFLIPKGGGHVTQFEGVPVQVLTAESPLGQALLGRTIREKIEVPMPGRSSRIYEILELC